MYTIDQKNDTGFFLDCGGCHCIDYWNTLKACVSFVFRGIGEYFFATYLQIEPNKSCQKCCSISVCPLLWQEQNVYMSIMYVCAKVGCKNLLIPFFPFSLPCAVMLFSHQVIHFYLLCDWMCWGVAGCMLRLPMQPSRLYFCSLVWPAGNIQCFSPDFDLLQAPYIVGFQRALSAGAKQTANNQSEQRHVTYTLSPSEWVTCASWGGAVSIFKKVQHGCLVTIDLKLVKH